MSVLDINQNLFSLISVYLDGRDAAVLSLVCKHLYQCVSRHCSLMVLKNYHIILLKTEDNDSFLECITREHVKRISDYDATRLIASICWFNNKFSMKGFFNDKFMPAILPGVEKYEGWRPFKSSTGDCIYVNDFYFGIYWNDSNTELERIAKISNAYEAALPGTFKWRLIQKPAGACDMYSIDESPFHRSFSIVWVFKSGILPHPDINIGKYLKQPVQIPTYISVGKGAKRRGIRIPDNVRLSKEDQLKELINLY